MDKTFLKAMLIGGAILGGVAVPTTVSAEEKYFLCGSGTYEATMNSARCVKQKAPQCSGYCTNNISGARKNFSLKVLNGRDMCSVTHTGDGVLTCAGGAGGKGFTLTSDTAFCDKGEWVVDDIENRDSCVWFTSPSKPVQLNAPVSVQASIDQAVSDAKAEAEEALKVAVAEARTQTRLEMIQSNLERVIEIGAHGPTVLYVAANAVCRSIYSPLFEKGEGLRCGVPPSWGSDPMDLMGTQTLAALNKGEIDFAIIDNTGELPAKYSQNVRSVFHIGKSGLLLLANVHVDRDIVLTVMRAILNDLDDFRNQHNDFQNMKPTTMAIKYRGRVWEGVVPLHPAADWYYKKAGWSLMQKPSDQKTSGGQSGRFP